MRFRFRGIPHRHAFINACCKFHSRNFAKLNSMIIMVKIVILAFMCYIWRTNRMKVYFHGAKLSRLSFFRNTHGICRMTSSLTDKSYINFQDVTSTLKNMRTALFARQSLGAVFRFVSDHRWGPLDESDIHSNTIRPTIDRNC